MVENGAKRFENVGNFGKVPDSHHSNLPGFEMFRDLKSISTVHFHANLTWKRTVEMEFQISKPLEISRNRRGNGIRI